MRGPIEQENPALLALYRKFFLTWVQAESKRLRYTCAEQEDYRHRQEELKALKVEIEKLETNNTERKGGK